MKILVIGGTGAIGRRGVPALTMAGHCVGIMVRSGSSR